MFEEQRLRRVGADGPGRVRHGLEVGRREAALHLGYHNVFFATELLCAGEC